MPVYGYQTYKPRYWVVEVRHPNGCSQGDTLVFGQGRQTAFAHFASKYKGCKIVNLFEVDKNDLDSMERYGFIPERIRPARINWSSLDLY